MIYNSTSQTKSVYIHWPFCPYKCHFCPFVAFAGQDALMEAYHRTLIGEITAFVQQSGEQRQLDTIYFGGGTPSTYPNHLLLDMFVILRKMFLIADTTEITLEVNPGTVNREKLDVWQQVGINRLSIGVQSLKDRVLTNLNRQQSREDVLRLMQEVGPRFNNVSVDIILGLPDVSEDEWRELLATVVTWPIQHISMYILEVHEGTALHVRIKTKDIELPPDDRLADLYAWSVDFLCMHGFQQYEVSSFAHPAHESRHNTVYWERKPYKGFGVGACSFDGEVRFQNGAHLHEYIGSWQQGGVPRGGAERLTRQQIINEKIMLGIRRRNGLDVRDILQDMTLSEQNTIQRSLQQLQQIGLIVQSAGRIMLTRRGLLVENTIATQLSLE